MSTEIKIFVFLLCITLIIDLIVINIFFKKNWEITIKNIQNENMVIKMQYALITYFLIPLGLLFFVYPRIDKKSWIKSSLIFGFMFGIIAYGIFDFTNLSLFKKYPLKLAIIDTIWGGILCASVVFICYYILEIKKLF